MAKRAFDVAFLVVFIGMAATCATLSYRLYTTRSTTVEQRALASVVGRKIAPLTGLSRSGTVKRLDWGSPDSRTTVIYAFSPTCVWCARNLPNLKALLAIPRSRLRIVGLSLSGQGLEDYLEVNGLQFDEVLHGVNSIDLVQDGLVATPTTMVVSAQGVVRKYWRGAYLQRSQPEVEAFFGLKLPGLKAEPAQP